MITLFKEVRNLIWLNFPVPHSLNTISKDAKRIYPYAVGLIDTLNTLSRAQSMINQRPKTNGLLNGYENDVFHFLSKGIGFRWESFIHIYDTRSAYDSSDNSVENLHAKFVHKLEETVNLLERKAERASAIYSIISNSLSELKVCDFGFDSFQTNITPIQDQVDKLTLEGFVNIQEFVNNLNDEIKQILIERCREIIGKWITSFEKPELGSILGVPNGVRVHELILKNRVIALHPLSNLPGVHGCTIFRKMLTARRDLVVFSLTDST